MISTVPAGAQVVTQAQVIVATETPQIPDTPSVSALLGTTVVAAGPATIPDTADVTDEDKTAIYRHPLFPLMALLLEKCEQATQSPDFPPSDSFDVDIQTFVANQEQQKLPFFSDDPQLDSLMVKAIQVLRIHLLELEKVNELCKDFCKRYIACLKGKLHSEHLLRTELGFEDDDFDSPPPPSSMASQVVTALPGSSVVTLQNVPPPVTPGVQQLNQQLVSQTVYQMVQTPQGLVAQPIQVQPGPTQIISQGPSPGGQAVAGSTPMSQIGLPSVSAAAGGASIAPSLPALEEEEEDCGKKRSKRGVLPKQATQVMRSWLFQHIVHPYPTEDEKRQIAQQTNLTLLQVNNWFINARRRILQPMLDAGNPDQSKAKKTKPQTRPAQRFWPDSLANLQPQATPAATQSSSPSTVSTAALSPGGSTELTQQTVTIQSMQGETTTQQILLPAGTFITTDGRIISSVGATTNEATQVTLATTNTTVIQESQARSEALTVKVETEASQGQEASGNEASSDDSSGDE